MAQDKSSDGAKSDDPTPKQDPSSTVSHSKTSDADANANLHSEDAVPPLAKHDAPQKHDSKVHDHNAAADAHDSHGHGHGDAPPVADFGEVIPEKNWQDSLLSSIAFCVLGGFVWLGLIWFQVQEPPAEASHQAGTVESNETAPPPVQLGLPPPTVPTINPEDLPQGGMKPSKTGAQKTAPSSSDAGSQTTSSHHAPIETAPKTPDNTRVRNSSQF
jgi:hypothetical protein